MRTWISTTTPHQSPPHSPTQQAGQWKIRNKDVQVRNTSPHLRVTTRVMVPTQP